jgi:hypothetical protein
MNTAEQFLLDKTNSYRSEGGLGEIACDAKANAACVEWSKGQCEAYAARPISAKRQVNYWFHV